MITHLFIKNSLRFLCKPAFKNLLHAAHTNVIAGNKNKTKKTKIKTRLKQKCFLAVVAEFV